MPSKTFERYAIYFLPETASPLAHFGRTWFGQNLEDEEENIERRSYGLGTDQVIRLTHRPSRYGFHGTLKAPFRLADDKTEQELIGELTMFAARQKSFDIVGLSLAELLGHLVLALPEKNNDLDELARACVSNFDKFRAPLNDAERERRQQYLMTERQHALFEQWGYPYTFEEFIFHITLTGPISNNEIAQVSPALAPALKDVSLEPVEVKSICLMGDPGKGETFKLLHRFPFGG